MTTVDISTIHLSAGDKADVQAAIKEAAGSLLRTEAERDLRKSIAKKAKDDWQISTSDFNKLVKIYHKQNLEEIQEETDEIISLYEMVFSK